MIEKKSYILKNIYPNKSVPRNEVHLTDDEIAYIKTLISKGYRGQDIHYLMNIGRKDTFNYGRIDDVKKLDKITLKTDAELDNFLKVQTSYHLITGLNPFKERHQRLIKSREAMLSAIQNYNTPSIKFKTELFCVLTNIAWTYLVHEYYEKREKGSSIRNINKNGEITNHTLSGLINANDFPIKDKGVIDNLKAIIEIRDKAEHTFYTSDLDNNLTPLFQSCCLNFEHYIKEWFGEEMSLTSEISLSLQMVGLQKEQIIALESYDLPKEIQTIVERINQPLIENSYAIKVYFTQEISSKTSSDVTKLIPYDNAEINNQVAVKKSVIEKIVEVEKEVIKKPSDTHPLNYKKHLVPTLKEKGVNSKILTTILNKHKLKENENFCYLHFYDKQQEAKFKKNKKLPKGIRCTYAPEIIDEIVRLYEIEKGKE